jgi:hypothetical protein
MKTNWMGGPNEFYDNPEPKVDNYPPYELEYSYPVFFGISGEYVVHYQSPQKSLVYYKDYESSMDWCPLANSFDEFLRAWISLGCPGPEMNDLEVFYDFTNMKLNPEGKFGKIWQEYLKN